MYSDFGDILTIIASLLVPIVGLIVLAKVIGGILGSTSGRYGTVSDSYHAWLYVIQQQHVGVIERLGKFHQVVGPGFHVRLPVVDRVRDVNLMTEDEHITFDAKTEDNVTIELDVSVQYHVDYSQPVDGPSGIYKSLYTLTDPVAQMKDYFADALRSQIPSRQLDEVFTEKDAIANAIDEIVSEKMLEYGYVIVTTLITSIKLPADVQQSMNRIIASKNDLESAKNEAEAERQKTVIAARAKAEAMEAEGRGIANQRVAIAQGIRDSIDVIQGSQLSSEEANRLFEYTQHIGMMEAFAQAGASTVVLPSEFSQAAPVLRDLLVSEQARTGE
ncbi:MAG: SPFH domain-containing protein [Acidobacteriota bacterium]|nr:SPFH domain-containing protein [Acidobacteriota bacterium]